MMRKNITQPGFKRPDNRRYIDNDWFPFGIAPNVTIGKGVYIDTSYGFAGFHSTKRNAFFIGEGSGCYDRTNIITGVDGLVRVGNFTILNGATLIANESVSIGDHCMLSWGSVVTDSWLGTDVHQRQIALAVAAAAPNRPMPFWGEPRAVVLGDNVWVGFGTVVMPGVTIGHGAVLGSKTVITDDVPPYAVVVGSPSKIIRYLDPTDTPEAKAAAFERHLSP
jgi:acetyltransferase-like isoleucine patch superfamily enzyme